MLNHGRAKEVFAAVSTFSVARSYRAITGRRSTIVGWLSDAKRIRRSKRDGHHHRRITKVKIDYEGSRTPAAEAGHAGGRGIVSSHRCPRSYSVAVYRLSSSQIETQLRLQPAHFHEMEHHSQISRLDTTTRRRIEYFGAAKYWGWTNQL